MSTPLDKLRHAYRQWHETKGNSADVWLALMADDVTMRSIASDAPEMKFSDRGRGKAEAAKYFAELVADWEMLHFTPTEFIEQGDRIVVLGSCGFKFRRTGVVVESPKCDVFRFRDGLIVDFFEFYDTAKAFAATRC